MSVVPEVARLDRDAIESIDAGTWSVLALSAVMFVAFSYYLVLLYQGYRLHATDLGRYVHMLATTLHGEGIFHAGVYRRFIPTGSYWGRHFTLTLFLFLPVFALFPSAVTLLVAKSFVVAASVPALWFVAREHVESHRLAGLLTVSYAFNPFLWSAWSFEFQEQVIVPVVVFVSYHAYVTGRYRRFLLAVGLALLTNEHMILITMGYLAGLAVDAWREGRIGRSWRPLAVGFAAATVAEAVAKYVVARYSVHAGFAKFRLSPPILKYVEGPTVGVSDLVRAVAAHPRVLPSILAYDASTKVAYFVALLAPVGFLALLEPVAVGAMAPWLGFAWAFGGKGSSYMFRAHYPYYLLPFVYLGAARVLGRASLPKPIARPSGRTTTLVLVTVLAVNATAGGIAGWGNLQPVPSTGPHERTLEAALDGVPEDASLVTQNQVYPHVATRPDATVVLSAANFRRYQERYGTVSPKYVVYDTTMGQWKPVERAFSDRLGEEYGLYRQADGIYVWKRGYDGEPRSIEGDG